jgi:predicted membrane-bound spermidine synthase
MQYFYFFTAGIGGAVVMAIELLGARVLAPYYGTSVYVWASVISVTLFALSLGYWLGGKIIDKFPSVTTLANILGISGLFLLFLPILSNSFLKLFDRFEIILGALMSSFTILIFPLTLLGMIVPILIRLQSYNIEKSGSVAGKLMAISTAGSILGTLLAGLIFIPFVGISKSFIILSICIFVLSIIGFLMRRKYLKSLIIVIFLLVFSHFSISLFNKESNFAYLVNGKVLEYIEGLYGNISLVDSGWHRKMFVNNILQAGTNKLIPITKGSLISSRDYLELIPYYVPFAKNALLIGLGGGIHHNMLKLYGIDVECVEIDNNIVKLARKYFNFSGVAIVEDGRTFLRKTRKKYDIIILDVFASEILPVHLFTKECFENIKNKLTQSGILAIHLIGSPIHITTKSVVKTLYTVFPEVVVYQSGVGNEIQQLYCFASSNKLKIYNENILQEYGFLGNEIVKINWNDGVLLTDDCSSLDIINAKIANIWRKYNRYF